MFVECLLYPGMLLGALMLSSAHLREEGLSHHLLVSSPLALGGLQRQVILPGEGAEPPNTATLPLISSLLFAKLGHS